MDMVTVADIGYERDFLTSPITVIREGDILHGDHTSLGADNGMAVAMMLSLMSRKEISHPQLELIFTVDEEEGMTGADRLETGHIKAKKMLNLDSEEEGIATIGCAGGFTLNLKKKIEREKIPDSWKIANLRLSGLRGGHSGIEIHKNIPNAIKVFTHVLQKMISDIPTVRIVAMDGGTKHNVIPYEADAVIAFPGEEEDKINSWVKFEKEFLSQKFQKEKMLDLKVCEISVSDISVKNSHEEDMIISSFYRQAMIRSDVESVLSFLEKCPTGVIEMSQRLPGMVEQSQNIAIMRTPANQWTLLISVRSNLGAAMGILAENVKKTASAYEISVIESGHYPEWEVVGESDLQKLYAQEYFRLNGEKPAFASCHAGMECCIFAKKIPGMDIISIGPDQLDIHTPKERVSISSVERTWNLVVEMLKRKNSGFAL